MHKSIEQRLAEALRVGEGPALEYGGVWRDWPALAAFSESVEAALAKAGAGPRANIGVIARSNYASAAGVVAAMAGGRCVSLISALQSPKRISDAAHEADVDVLAVSEADVGPLWDWARESGLSVVCLSDAGARLLSRGDRASAGVDESEAIKIATSGSTGEPRIVPLSRATLTRALDEIREFNLGFGDRPISGPEQPPLFMYSPLSHVAGALTLLRACADCRRLVVVEKFTPAAWVRFVKTYQPRTTGLPPTMMRMVLDYDPPRDDLRSLVSVWSGQMPVDRKVAGAFEEKYGALVLGNYGATEFCGAIAQWTIEDHRTYGESKAGSVGRISPRVARARIVAMASGDVLETGEVGLLEVDVFRIAQGWLRTTDLASLDADGFLFLHGRADSAIMRGGFKILPDTVAHALMKHEDVRDAAVLAMADERLGEAPVAFVELGPGASVTSAQLMAFVRANLLAYQVPVTIHILPQLPRTQSHKIDRSALREVMSARR